LKQYDAVRIVLAIRYCDEAYESTGPVTSQPKLDHQLDHRGHMMECTSASDSA